jgi:hypothetical protein
MTFSGLFKLQTPRDLLGEFRHDYNVWKPIRWMSSRRSTSSCRSER